jgi:hypothetical protein
LQNQITERNYPFILSVNNKETPLLWWWYSKEPINSFLLVWFCTPNARVFLRLLIFKFSVMQNENQTAPSHSVMQALATFANQKAQEFDLTQFAVETQELTELWLDTELADERDLRQNALRALRFIRDYSKAMAVFTTNEVFEQTENLNHV